MTSPCNKPCASTPRWRHEHPEAAGIAQLQDTGGEEILVSDTGSEHALRFGGGGAAAVASSCPRFTGFSASRGSDSDAGASDTMGMTTWPTTADELTQLQQALGELTSAPALSASSGSKELVPPATVGLPG